MRLATGIAGSLAGIAGAVIVAVVAAAADAAPEQVCERAKLVAAARAARGRVRCEVLAARRGGVAAPACVAKVVDRLQARFAAAEAEGGCRSMGDAASVAAGIEVFAGTVAALVRPVPSASSCAAAKLAAVARAVNRLVAGHAADATRRNAARFVARAARVEERFTERIAAAEARGGCLTSGDSAVLTREIVALADRMIFALGAPLAAVAAPAGRLVGSAVEPGDLLDPAYVATLTREFNYVTTENATKWGVVEPAPGVWQFAPADAVVDFAETHGMQVKLHTLVWHSQLPGYVNDTMTAAELTAALHEHITTLVGRYRGRVLAWDVVNEAVDDLSGGLRDTVFLRTLGPEYIATAFQLAHAADPDALLFYNDYWLDALPGKLDVMYDLVSDLLQQGVPIHGVGLQMHVGYVFGVPAADFVRQQMERFAALGLLVNISEMDVQVKSFAGDTTAKLDRQRAVYRDLVGACAAVPECHAVTFWQFRDADSWVHAYFGPDMPLLFADDYTPKPAYFGVRDGLLGRTP